MAKAYGGRDQIHVVPVLGLDDGRKLWNADPQNEKKLIVVIDPDDADREHGVLEIMELEKQGKLKTSVIFTPGERNKVFEIESGFDVR